MKGTKAFKKKKKQIFYLSNWEVLTPEEKKTEEKFNKSFKGNGELLMEAGDYFP